MRILLIAALALPGFGMTRVQIGSVAPTYRPTAGTETPEPVTMQDYRFEVNRETGRARVVVDYTYPDQPAFGPGGGPGPAPTAAQIPGLKFDRESNSVVYQDAGRQTVCATAHHSGFVSTGACTVVANVEEHAADDGFSVHHMRAVDTYFEVK